MRILMRFNLLFCLLLPLLFSSSYAKIISVNEKSSTHFYNVSVLESNSQFTILEFQLNKFNLDEISIDGQPYSLVALDNNAIITQKGLPELPRVTSSLIIAGNSNLNLKILEKKQKNYSFPKTAPSKGTLTRNIDPKTIKYTFSSFYERNHDNKVFPERNIFLSKPYKIRKTNGVNITINPFQAQSASNEMLVTTYMKVKINHKSQGFLIPENNVTFNNILSSTFLNYQSSLQRSRTHGPVSKVNDEGSILVISHKSFVPGLKSFLTHKRRMGHRVKLITTNEAGENALEIKKTIQEAYNNDQDLAFVILVGDSEFVPFYPGTAGNARNQEADPMYGLVDGDDSYPDLVVGRISVQNAQELKIVLQRSMSYELGEADGEWLSKASGIASNQGWPTDAERADKLKGLLENYGYTTVDRHYEPTVQTYNVSDSINEGRGFINYIGHGSITRWVSGNFSNYEIDDLTNFNKWPVIVSVACVNGKFNYSGGDSFAERWLKANVDGKPTGAVSVFASSTNQSWVPPTVGQLQITQLIHDKKLKTVGALMTNGSIAVLKDASSSAEQTFQTWHIFGDPSLMLRTQVGEKLEDIYKANILVEGHEVVINNARIGDRITLSEDNKMVSTMVVEKESLDSYTFSTKGATHITISGYNKVPFTIEL